MPRSPAESGDPPSENSWLRQLEDLHSKQQDEKFLLQIADHPDRLDRSTLRPIYDEVVDRALFRTLREGDLSRLSGLFVLLHESVRDRPLVLLAFGLLELSAGRLSEAAQAIGRIDPTASRTDRRIARWIRRIRSPLLVLSAPTSSGTHETRDPIQRQLYRHLPLALRTQITDFLRFRRAALRSLDTTEMSSIPGDVRLATPRGRFLWAFYRQLRGFRTGKYRPGPKTAQKLQKILDERNDSETTGEIFPIAQERLRLFYQLVRFERSLSRQRIPRPAARRHLANFLSAHHDLLARGLAVPVPGLLAWLENAWQSRWRELLHRLGEDFGESTWTSLFGRYPQVLDPFLQVHEPAQQKLARWIGENDQWMRQGRFPELVQRLREITDEDLPSSEQRARLWACELAFRRRWLTQIGSLRGSRPEAAEIVIQQTIDRLWDLSSLGGAAFSTKTVSRAGRDALYDLGPWLRFPRPLLPMILYLQRSADEDPLLPVIGLLVATETEDQVERNRFESALQNRTLDDSSRQHLVTILRTLMLSAEPELAGHALSILHKHLASLWDQIRPPILLEVRQRFLIELWHAADQPPAAVGKTLPILERAAESLQPFREALGNNLEVAAVETVLQAWSTNQEKASTLGHHFLERFDDLEAPVALYAHLATIGRRHAAGLRHLKDVALEAIIHRLDTRWPIWSPILPLLDRHLDHEYLGRFFQRILDLSTAPEVAPEDRRALHRAADRVAALNRRTTSFGRPHLLPRWHSTAEEESP